MRDGVDVKILTGARCMRADPRPGDSATEAAVDLQETATSPVQHGVQLLEQLRHLQSRFDLSAETRLPG
jgi:hypothetical protein